MLKITTITIAMLFILGTTFIMSPSAEAFEDYITAESTIQGAEETGEAPVMDESGRYYEAPAAEEAVEAPVIGEGDTYYETPSDEAAAIEDQEIIEQDELKESEELTDEGELEE